MKRISTLFAVIVLTSMLILLGCNIKDTSIQQKTIQPKKEKLAREVDIVNNDRTSEVDWKSYYKVIDKVKFHVLIDEHLDDRDKHNPNTSILVRDYWCFDRTGEWVQVYPLTDKIALPKSNIITTALDFKNQIKKLNPISLNLRENTIMSNNVLNQWNEEKYDTKFEYSKESPEGLTYEMLQRSF